MSTKMLETALGLAQRGWRVFPVFPVGPDGTCSCKRGASCTTKPGKHPAIKGWPNNATTDPAQITTWWEQWPKYNIGIATGHESNLLVLDADSTKGQLTAQEYGLPPNTPSVRTGRVDGGIHYYFQCPDDFDARNFAGEIPGLDARANGGYVIAVGSKHATGAIYAWEVEPDGELPMPPEWFTKILKEKADKRDPEADKSLIQGQRNDAMFKMARGLRRAGQSEEQVLTSLRHANLEVCRPPLPDAEVQDIAASACKEEYGTGPNLLATIEDKDLGSVSIVGSYLRTYPLTEVGNAECFTELYGGRFRYVPEWKTWLKWNNSIWAEDKSAAHKRGMLMTVRARGMAAQMLPDPEERRALHTWARQHETNARINGALQLAAVLPSVSAQPEQFDLDPHLVTAEGRTWNLQKGTYKKPEMADYVTRVLGAQYDTAAECPLWLKVLDDVFQHDQEMIDYFQRAVGYSMTGNTSEQVMFMCVGVGANGKSTILGAVRDVLGTYAASARFETFDADVKSTTGDDLAALRGKRLVLVIEADQQRKLAEGRIKQVTGGSDLITCRHLYGKDFSYRPEFKIWMAVNHKPMIRGQDEGIWRRIHLLPFNARFDGDTRDPFLDEKLRDELPGILNWALEGARQWYKQGLNPPATVQKATKDYRAESDIVGLWMADCVTEDPSAETTQAEIYLSYRNWAGDNGIRPLSANMLGRILTERGFVRGSDKKRKTTYRGIAVNELDWSVGVD